MAADSPPMEPAEAGALKEEGNKLFRAGDIEAARDKYHRAIIEILKSSSHLPMTLMQSIALAGWTAGHPDTLLFYTHALTAFPFSVSNIPAFCAVLKNSEENGGMGTGMWLLGVLHRKTMHRDDIPKDAAALMSGVFEEYRQELPDQVARCVSAPEQSSVSLGLQVLFSRRAVYQFASAVNSFKGDCEQTENCVNGDREQNSDPASSASAPATLSRTLQLKEEGDRERDRKNYAAAVAKWREALSGFVMLPILLNNLAQAFVKMGGETAALLNALAVLAVQPSNVKAHARAANVALIAKWFEAAAVCTIEGLRYSPTHPDLLRIQKKALAALGRSDNTTAGASSTAPVSPPPATHCSMHAQASPSPALERSDQELPSMGNTVFGIPSGRRAMEQNPKALSAAERCVGPIPDDFCNSYLDAHVLPANCDGLAATAILVEASAKAFTEWEWHAKFCAPVATCCASKGSKRTAKDPMQFVRQGALAERLSSSTPERLAWFKDAPIGTLNFKERFAYPEEILTLFANVAQHAPAIPVAGTHVAVGFVDLGELAGTVAMHQSASAQTDEQGGTDTDGVVEVLRWVGIDQSAFCCARTLVILKMMERGVDSHEIVQVWYSAGWSAATLHDFHACVAAVLEAPSGAHTAEVWQWLQAWHGTTVPLDTARATWARRALKSTQQTWIGNLLRKDDRMAACAFAVSGDVLFPESPETVGNVIKLRERGEKKSGKDSKLEVSTGSVLMFPDSIRGAPPGEFACNDSFLYVVPPAELIAERLQGNNLLLAAAVCAMRRVDALARAIRAKHVTCEVWHSRLAPDTLPDIKRVRALEPTSMSWSNLCDYIDPSALMQLLRSCAKAGCPHFMHALNWKMDIKGGFIMDYGYPASSSKKGVAQAKERVQIWEDAHKLIRVEVKAQRAERLMRVQPTENPMSVCEVLLAQRMLPKWLEGLAARDKCSGKGAGVTFEVLHAPQYWAFSRVHCGAHFVLRCGGGTK